MTAEAKSAIQVFVDATMSNSQDPASPHEFFIAYFVEGREDLQGIKQVSARQIDEAELEAIRYAIEELADEPGEFEIFSDHESVVFGINKDLEVESKLEQVRSQLRTHKNIKVSLFRTNPADRYLREQLAKRKVQAR
jgi:ribonuclease HI